MSKTTDSYWDGFMYGIIPVPGVTFDSPVGYRNISDVEFPYSLDREPITGHPISPIPSGEFRDLSPEDQAFWAGWAAGVIAISGSMLAFATIIGAEGGALAGMTLSAIQLLSGTVIVSVGAAAVVITVGALIAGTLAHDTSKLHHHANPERSSDPEFWAVLMGLGSWGTVV